MIDLKQLRELPTTELEKKADELKADLVDLRIKKATNQVKNPHELRVVRRDIARVLTVLNEKEAK